MPWRALTRFVCQVVMMNSVTLNKKMRKVRHIGTFAIPITYKIHDMQSVLFNVKGNTDLRMTLKAVVRTRIWFRHGWCDIITHSDDELLSFQIATCAIEDIQVDCIEGERSTTCLDIDTISFHQDESMDTTVNEIEPQGPNQQTSTHIIMPGECGKYIHQSNRTIYT